MGVGIPLVSESFDRSPINTYIFLNLQVGRESVYAHGHVVRCFVYRVRLCFCVGILSDLYQTSADVIL